MILYVKECHWYLFSRAPGEHPKNAVMNRLLKMRSCGLVHINPTVAKGFSTGEVEQLDHCLPVLRSKSKLKLEVGSSWNCCGRLIAQIYECSTDDYQCLYGCQNISRFKCSSHTSEKLPSVLQNNPNSCLFGWLSQLFSSSLLLSSRELGLKQSERSHMDSDIHSCGLASPLSLENDGERICDALRTFTMQPFDQTRGLPLESEYLQEQSLTAKLLGESGIPDSVTSLPSTNTVQKVSLSYDTRIHLSKKSPGFSNSPAQYGELLSASRAEKDKAEFCARKPHSVTPDELGSPEALALWLSDRLPQGISQLKSWGTAPGTKAVANLWIELVEGEILLEDVNPPRRTVHVASVKIKNEVGQLLVEAHQEMADGSIRMRNRPLSEKMRPGENVEDACFRGIFEELGCQLGAKNRVNILANSYRRQEEERESFSYPGLLTLYVIHSVDATVDNLPKIGFYTVENELGGGDLTNDAFIGLPVAGVKKHFWRWVSQAS